MLFLLAGPLPPVVEDGKIVFRWKGEAQQVTIAGTFNNWDKEAEPLQKGEDNIWFIKKELTPGVYEYKFVIDGEWMPGPNLKVVVAMDEQGRIFIKRERPGSSLSNWWANIWGRWWSRNCGYYDPEEYNSLNYSTENYVFLHFDFDFSKKLYARIGLLATTSSWDFYRAAFFYRLRPVNFTLFANMPVFSRCGLFFKPYLNELAEVYRPVSFPLEKIDFDWWGWGWDAKGVKVELPFAEVFWALSNDGTQQAALYWGSEFKTPFAILRPRILAFMEDEEEYTLDLVNGWAEYPPANPYGVWYHFDVIDTKPARTIHLQLLAKKGILGAAFVSEWTWGPSLYLHADMSNGKEPGGPGYDHPVDVEFSEPEKYRRSHYGGFADIKLNLLELLAGAVAGTYTYEQVDYSSMLVFGGLRASFLNLWVRYWSWGENNELEGWAGSHVKLPFVEILLRAYANFENELYSGIIGVKKSFKWGGLKLGSALFYKENVYPLPYIRLLIKPKPDIRVWGFYGWMNDDAYGRPYGFISNYTTDDLDSLSRRVISTLGVQLEVSF